MEGSYSACGPVPLPTGLIRRGCEGDHAPGNPGGIPPVDSGVTIAQLSPYQAVEVKRSQRFLPAETIPSGSAARAARRGGRVSGL